MPLPVVGKAHEAPSGKDFHWFIYGSSLNRRAFADWALEHGYRPPNMETAIPTRLPGYRLAFDVMSRFWGGAVADLLQSSEGSVEGIALPLPGSARGLVDHKEGAISGLYLPFEVEVIPLAGGPALTALAYRANPGRRLPEEATPSEPFLTALIAGARDFGLSQGYLAELTRRLGP